MQIDDLVIRAKNLAERGGRRILGICGSPGSGKSTLADRLVTALGAAAVYVGMDGFHLAQAELDRLERTDRKGAPDTFDAAGYVAMLERLRCNEGDGDIVYAPRFHREIEEPIAGEIPVPPHIPLVITEGNYLLLSEPPWRRVRELIDEVWFLELDEDERLRRLIARHIAFGRTPEQALRQARGSDQRNAERIAPTSHRADLVINPGITRRPHQRG